MGTGSGDDDRDAGGREDRVDEAMRAVPRSRFLPRAQRPFARRDGPLPIGHGQTCSQPRTVAAMLRLLDVAPGHRVLDVGAGSGWTTALLAHLVGPQGRVIGVELEPDLAQRAQRALQQQHASWAQVRAAEPDVLGAPQDAPFDRVLVSAMAREVPDALLDQLTPGGLMVLPAAGELLLVRSGAAPGEAPRVSRHGAYRFVPLR